VNGLYVQLTEQGLRARDKIGANLAAAATCAPAARNLPTGAAARLDGVRGRLAHRADVS